MWEILPTAPPDKIRREGAHINGNPIFSAKKEAESPSKLSPKAYILMGLVTACLMIFPTVASEITAIVALALPLLFALFGLRSKGLAIAVGAFAAISLFSVGTLSGAAYIVSVIAIIGLGAATALHLKPWLSALLALAAYAVSFVVTGDPIASLATLLFVPSAILLAILIARGVDRVPAIGAVSICLLITIAVPVLFAVYGAYGELSAATLTSIINGLRSQALEAYTTSIPLLPEELQAAATEELFHNAFDAIIALFPAIVVVACLLPSFVAHLVAVTVCRRTDYAKKLTLGAQIFVMSKVSAVVFIIAFLLPVLGLGSSQEAQIISVTAENINLMLLPAFLLVGALGIIGFFLRQRGCLNFWSVLALIALIVYGGGFVLYPLAFFGAIRTLRTPRHFRH